jgi:hypothetical protein
MRAHPVRFVAACFVTFQKRSVVVRNFDDRNTLDDVAKDAGII